LRGAEERAIICADAPVRWSLSTPNFERSPQSEGPEGDLRVDLSRDESARRGALLAGTEQLSETGSWDWDLRTNDLLWSDNLFRLFGLEPGEITPTPELVAEQTHPDDRERVIQYIAAAREGDASPFAYRIVRKGGDVRHFRSTVMVVERSAAGPIRLIGSVQDLTERRRTERELAAHTAVSEALAGWTSLDESGTDLLRRLGEALEFETGTLWTVRDDLLVPRICWSAGTFDISELYMARRSLRLSKEEGLPGRAWALREPINVVKLADAPVFGRVDPAGRRAAESAGLRGALALPVLIHDEVLAVLDFYSREEVELTDRLMHSLTGIAHGLGSFLDRRRGELGPPSLTTRELEVLQLAALGLSGPEVAARLVVSPATVKTHFENIYRKLAVGDRASAVARALRLGLIN
jgi:PAS domain S-box-containing protein